MTQQRLHPPVTQDRGALAAVCGEIAWLIRQRRGLGPSRCTAYWAGRGALVVLLDDTYTCAEEDLRAHGHAAEVQRARELFGETAKEDFKEIVERITGHRVDAVLSASHVDPDKSALVFVLRDQKPELDAAMERASEQQEETRALLAESRQVARRSAQRRAASD